MSPSLLHNSLPSFDARAALTNFFLAQLITTTMTTPVADNPKNVHRQNGSGVLIAINATAPAQTRIAHSRPCSMNFRIRRLTFSSLPFHLSLGLGRHYKGRESDLDRLHCAQYFTRHRRRAKRRPSPCEHVPIVCVLEYRGDSGYPPSPHTLRNTS